MIITTDVTVNYQNDKLLKFILLLLGPASNSSTNNSKIMNIFERIGKSNE